MALGYLSPGVRSHLFFAPYRSMEVEFCINTCLLRQSNTLLADDVGWLTSRNGFKSETSRRLDSVSTLIYTVCMDRDDDTIFDDETRRVTEEGPFEHDFFIHFSPREPVRIPDWFNKSSERTMREVQGGSSSALEQQGP
jgi:hypothetical protein